MTRDQIERVFGRARLKMVTGEHVEVFREAVVAGERRRYTKRFLNSTDGDFGHWTEREWRILARLIGHGIGCVPDVVQFDRGSVKGAQLVQTYDAGVTVDQWATLLPLRRDGHVYRHAFEDCGHWWALTHYCLAALKEIHQLQLVHLDIKGDNVCVPFGPASFDPQVEGATLYPLFGQLALIDFAFSLVSGESLTVALPIGWQREYDYQSPRLLQALVEGQAGDLRKTRELDWRCDIYSLAAMLKRYLPDAVTARPPERATGWTSGRYDAAKALIVSLRDFHDGDLPQRLPHQALIDATGEMLRESDLAQSLASGWTLAHDMTLASGVAAPITPMTRIAPPIRVFRKPRDRASPDQRSAPRAPLDTAVPLMITRRNDALPAPPRRNGAAHAALAAAFTVVLGAAVAHQVYPDAVRTLSEGARALLDDGTRRDDAAPSAVAGGRASPDFHAGADVPQREASAPPSAPSTGTNVAADATPPIASSPPSSVADESATMPGESVEDHSETGSAERGRPAASPPSAKTAAAAPPSSSRMVPKGAPPAEEPARAAGRRGPTKSAPLPSPRPSVPVTTAKASPSRPLVAAPRAAPTIAAPSSSVGAVPTPAEGAYAVRTPATAPAPPQLIELVPPPSQAASTASAPALALQSGQTASPSSPVAGQGQPGATSQETAPAAPKTPSTTRRARAADEEWRAGINALSQFFGFTKRKTAPIEDRSLQEITPATKPARAPQAASPVPDAPVSAAPRFDVPPPVAMMTPTPRVDLPPLAMATPAPRTAAPPPPLPDARTDYRSLERSRDSDYALQARRTLAQGVPRIAMQTQVEIAQVLWAAARAQDPRQEREIVDYAQGIAIRDGVTAYTQTVEPAAARRLNEEAMQAYWVRRNVPEAFDLSLKAFGANPNDPEVAGNLAFLHLRMSPVQPEMARQLALHAIAVRGTRFRSGRLEDWNTYALASALTGRDTDARNAMYVTVALAGSVERNCKAGLSAMANYGERVREPVEAMLYRIHTQGRAHESPYCAWPPNWAMGMRRQ